jgi:hypothetical protein
VQPSGGGGHGTARQWQRALRCRVAMDACAAMPRPARRPISNESPIRQPVILPQQMHFAIIIRFSMDPCLIMSIPTVMYAVQGHVFLSPDPANLLG